MSTPSAIVRTSAQHRVGGYRPELPHSGDLEMWLRLAAVGSVAISSESGVVPAPPSPVTNTNSGFSALSGRAERCE